MSDEQATSSQEAADRVLEMAEEVEASGEAMFDESEVELARAALHEWVDSLDAIVSTPAFGRVTVIHKGVQTTISSPDLPFILSAAVNRG